MLCDDFADFLATTKEGTPEAAAEAARQLRIARRYFLQPNFVATATELADADAVERSRPFIFLPDTALWLEWRENGASRGMLLNADDDNLREATGYRVQPGAGAIEAFNFDANKPARQMMTPHPAALPAQHSDYEEKSLWLAAAIALLQTPRLLERRSLDHTRLNAKRVRTGKPALLSYTEVHVNIDRPSEGGGARNGEGVALHRVRAHPRLSRGRVQIVRACWRGNPRHGVKLHHYIVKREEDNDLAAADLVKPPCAPERRLLGPTLPPEIADDPSLQAHLGRLEARNG